jgi:twitching motility two-component system response regulator PilG
MRLELHPLTTSVPVSADIDQNSSQDKMAAAAESLQEGIRAAQSGDRARARAALLRTTELDPRSENAWLWLASISEYPEELLVFLTNVLEINPENARAIEWTAATRSLLAKTFVQRGIDAFNENRREFALECFTNALEHEENNGMAWLWMASLANSYEEKVSCLERVLGSDPENAEARCALDTVRAEIRDKRLADAKAAAVSGNSAEALSFINSLLDEFPEYEEGWILKSHLVDNFAEKIACYERVLEVNPGNTTALVGRESLLALVGPAAAPLAVEESGPAEENRVLSPEKAEFFEAPAIDKNPTQDLELPENLESSSFAEPADAPAEEPVTFDPPEQYEESVLQIAQEPNSPFTEKAEDPAEALVEVQPAAEPYFETGFAFTSAVPDEQAAQSVDSVDVAAFFEYSPEQSPDAGITQPEENYANGSAEIVGNHNGSHENEAFAETISDLPFVAEASAEPEPQFVEQASPVIEAAPVEAGIPMPAGLFDMPDEVTARTGYETYVVTEREDRPKNSEIAPCAFCNSDNESQAIMCQSCMAVLTLSDLEMLLGNQNADKTILRQAVENMERERTFRPLSESELTMLGIGHLNLHNLQYGYNYLQEASQLNPNNVVLAGQVNALHIRLEDIKKKDEALQRMPKNKTILVIDDSPTVRKLIAGKLEKCGHDVFCCNDGIEAMERLEDLVPDLILLDITMPRMDGYQVCKMIRGKEATKDVPIVMISGKDGFFDKVRGRMAGTSGYITKPFGPETLMRAVEAYLKGEVQEEIE